MGTFLFRWPHPANDVHVTGTFDDWGKSEQLVKVGDVWEKEVHLPNADEKILYKFVVDDQWITDHEAPKEDDGHYNVNNVLYPNEIKKDEPEKIDESTTSKTEEPATSKDTDAAILGGTGAALLGGTGAALLSSAHPDSTTAAMAGQVPKEEGTASAPSFLSRWTHPEPTASAGDPTISSAAPESTTATMAGEVPKEETPEIERKMSPPGAFPEDEPESFGIAPIPASDSMSNPEPGTVNTNTVDSTATTSKEGYERDASAPYLPTKGPESDSYSVKPIPATSGIGNPVNLPAGAKVPDSSNFTTNTVDSTATTSKEGYEHAGEAAAGVLGGAAIGGAAYSAFSKPDEEKKNIIPESSLPMDAKAADTMDSGPFMSSAAPSSTTAQMAGAVPLEKKRQGMVIDPTDAPTTDEAETAPSVPKMVQESMKEAHEDPEAATSTEAVEEKSAMEKELLSKTTSSEDVGEPASAAKLQTSYYGLATAVPVAVEHSMSKAGAAPEAAADSSAVAEKSMVEQELLNKVPTAEGVGEPAPTTTASTSETAPGTTKETAGTDMLPGTSAVAAAAVADGADRSETSAPEAPTRFIPAEKTDGDATDYAPVRDAASAPGVSSAAAAAVSDGTEDPKLADEPAVQMMRQQEAMGTDTTAGTSEAAEKEAANEAPVSSETPIAAAAPTSTSTEPMPTTTNTGTDGAADEKTLAPIPDTNKREADLRKRSEIRDVSPGTADPKKKVLGPSAAGTTSTPAKATPSGTSSPPSSATKDKKKKHRISGFFKKIFD